MATKAYLLVETAVGKTREVANTLKGLEGIETVDVVTGPYDIIAIIHAEDMTVVGNLVTGHIHRDGCGADGYLRGGRFIAPGTSEFLAAASWFSISRSGD
jgi:DNA-binding Lrp family transcriptional regulator